MRMGLRLRTPGETSFGFATVDEWVEAFNVFLPSAARHAVCPVELVAAR
jgi:hypothetical protein